MKKFLSCVLALALVFSLMSMTVFADAVVGNGANGTENNGTYKDGEATFDDRNSTSDVTLQFNKKNNEGEYTEDSIIEGRYAVDITYWDLVIDLGEVLETVTGESKKYTYIWNVDTYAYDLVTEDGTIVSPETENDATTKAYEIQAFQITNHSDASIFYSATPTLETLPDANMDLKITISNPEVAKATAATYDTDGNKNAGSPTKGNIETLVATPAQTWIQTVNNLIAQVASGAVVGHLTVTISMDNPNP